MTTSGRKSSPVTEKIAFTLEAVPPFRLDLTAWTLRRRPENRIDAWDGETYRRVLALDDGAVEVCIRQQAGTSLHITAETSGRPERKRIAQTVERMLGLRVDLTGFYRFAARDPRLKELAGRFRGAKPPRFPTIFEALCNGISGQQVSLAVAITLLNRLAEAYGPARGAAHAFPRPEDLAGASPEHLRSLGYSGAKARALIELAEAAASGRTDLESLADLDDDEAIARLKAIRGVGRWTAEYVLLRGFGRMDRFPGDDVGARNNLARWLGLKDALDYGGVARLLDPWRPYAGLIYFHLLLDKLDAAGHLTAVRKSPPEAEAATPRATPRIRSA